MNKVICVLASKSADSMVFILNTGVCIPFCYDPVSVESLRHQIDSNEGHGYVIEYMALFVNHIGRNPDLESLPLEQTA